MIKSKYVLNFTLLLLLVGIFHWWLLPWVIVWWDFRISTQDFFLSFLSWSLWNDTLLWGISLDYSGYLNKYPIYFISWVLSFFGIDYQIVQRIVFLFPIIISGLIGVQLLSRYLFKDKQLAFFLSVIYLSFPFFLENIYRSHVWFSLVYVSSPFLAYFSLKFIESRNYKFWLAIPLVLAILFSIEPRMWLLMSLIILLVVFVLSMDELLRHPRYYLWSLIGIVTIFILLSAYWIIPTFLNLLYWGVDLISSDITKESYVRYSASNFGWIINGLTFIPKNWWNYWLYFGITFFIVFLVIYIKRTRNTYNFPISLFLFFLALAFLAKGVSAPFWEINFELLSSNIILSAYKTTNKFLYPAALIFILLLWSVLIKLKNTKRIYAMMIFSLLMFGCNTFLFSWYINSFWIGTVDGFKKYFGEQHMFQGKEYIDYSHNIEIYEYIKLKNEWKFHKTLWLPTIHSFRLTWNKSPYLDTNFYAWSKVGRDVFAWPNWEIIKEYDLSVLSEYFCKLNIWFIVLKSEKETEWWYVRNNNFQDYKELLDKVFILEKEIWGTRLYTNNCSEFLTKEWANYSLIHNSYISSGDISLVNMYDRKDAIFKGWYHKWWKIYLKDTQWLFMAPLFEDTHTKVYDYANGWTISKDEIVKYVEDNYSQELSTQWYPRTLDDGRIDYKYYMQNPDGSIDVELTLYFRPQLYFYIGLIISGTTLAILIISLIVISLRERRTRRESESRSHELT